MKQWLRRYLGIEELFKLVEDTSTLNRHMNAAGTATMRAELSTISTGVARLIAKVDPMFAAPEIDPERKAASDKLTNETIARLRAEYAARAPYNQVSDE